MTTKFNCMDCGADPRNPKFIDYMIRTDIWKSVVGTPGHRGVLCLTCLENRLSRRLELNDFTLCGSNVLEYGRIKEYVQKDRILAVNSL